MSKRFWGGWFGGSKRFSLEDLHYQYATLVKHPVVNESNKALVVETIRSIAEFMIWGDQNEPKVFEFFLENNVMVYLHKILLQPANRRGEVAKQVLQTLSIIIQNVKSETGIFFLFSNNHINNIVELVFDFDDEEVLGYYVSFLKTISLKLNPGTVQFFFNKGPDHKHNFPLYTEAVKFAHHKEGMVRAAVRTLTLNIYCVQDISIQDFIVTTPASQYFTDVAVYVADQIQNLDKRMQAAENGHSVTALSALDSQLAEVEDIITYCSDVFSNAPKRAADLLSEQLWTQLSGPMLLSPLLELVSPVELQADAATHRSSTPGSCTAQDPHPYNSPKNTVRVESITLAGGSPRSKARKAGVRAVCSLYIMERIFCTINFSPLLHHLVLGIFLLASAHQPAPTDACLSSSPPTTTTTTTRMEPPAAATPAQPHPHPAQHKQQAKDILTQLLYTSDIRTMAAALRLLVSILQNKYVSPALLNMLGLLPRSRTSALDPADSSRWLTTLTSLLTTFPLPSSPTDFSIPASPAQLPTTSPRFLTYDDALGGEADPQAATAHRILPLSSFSIQEDTQEDTDTADRPAGPPPEDAPPSTSSSDGTTLHTPRRQRQQQQQHHHGKSPRSPAGRAVDAVLESMVDDLEETLSVQSARELGAQLHGGTLLDTLLSVLQQPVFPASGLWHTGWLLHQLLPKQAPGQEAGGSPGSALQPAQERLLDEALAAARLQLQDELGGMWCEALFPLLNMQWPITREGMSRPVLRPSSDSLLSGPAAYPLLRPRTSTGGRGEGGLSTSAAKALQSFHVVQRSLCLVQMAQLLHLGAIPTEPSIPAVSDVALKAAEIQEGAMLDITLGSALPCYVSFSPGNEKKVFFAVSGVSLRRLTSIGKEGQENSAMHRELVHSLPVVVLAEPSAQRQGVGVVQSVAPLMGAEPTVDKNINKWLHVHVRPSVRGLMRVLKSSAVRKGGLLAAMRQLADGHWVLAFSDAERAMNAKLLVEQHAAKLRALYCEVLAPLAAAAATGAGMAAVDEAEEDEGGEESFADAVAAVAAEADAEVEAGADVAVQAAV